METKKSLRRTVVSITVSLILLIATIICFDIGLDRNAEILVIGLALGASIGIDFAGFVYKRN